MGLVMMVVGANAAAWVARVRSVVRCFILLIGERVGGREAERDTFRELDLTSTLCDLRSIFIGTSRTLLPDAGDGSGSPSSPLIISSIGRTNSETYPQHSSK